MSQFPQSFRASSPATGPQAVRGQERKVPVGGTTVTMAQPRPKSASAAGNKTSQADKRFSPVSGWQPTNLLSNRRSPVLNERSGLGVGVGQLSSRASGDGVGGAGVGMGGVGAFEARPAADALSGCCRWGGAKQKRSTLAQGSATAGRRPAVNVTFSGGSGGVAGFTISANGTPRTQYSDAVTPRGVGAAYSQSVTVVPHTPSVTVNPNFDGTQKSSIGLRHHSAVKAGGIAYEAGLEGSCAAEGPGAAMSQRRLLTISSNARRKEGSAPSTAGSASTVDAESHLRALGYSNSSRDFGGWASVEQQRHSITQAIGLLENSQLLQQDAVLRDIVQGHGTDHSEQAERVTREARAPPQRVVVTSENGTQVHSVETATQTDLPEFKEKRIRPLAKGKMRRLAGDGQSCSLSDSDVPSDQNDTIDLLGLGRRRNSLDDVSLSTNSPRESFDGYSRDTSEASGPASVSSMVQTSVASSTDASQTATLTHDATSTFASSSLCADYYDDNLEAVHDGMQAFELWDGEKMQDAHDVGSHIAGCSKGGSKGSLYARPPSGLKSRPLMSPLQALNVNLNHYIGTYQHELEGISEVGNSHSPEGSSLSPTEKQMLAMSPSPSIETLLELKRILDHHYAKLYQAGKLAGCYAINSPATAEMQRLTMESTLVAENSGAETGGTPERPPNPGPDKWSPEQMNGNASLPLRSQPQAVEASACDLQSQTFEIPCTIRMGNSPPKHKNVKTPLTQLRALPTLNLPPARRSDSSALESPLSTPRSGSAFLAHINSARSSTNSATNSGSASSTPRFPQGVMKIESV